MYRPILKFSHKTLKYIIVFTSFLTLILAIVFGAFVWQLSKGPISLVFAKDYVQTALSGEQEGYAVTFEDIVLTWPKIGGRLELDLTGLRVSKGLNSSNALYIKEAAVGLSRRALLVGRIRPMSVIIKQPSLELVRSRNGRMEVFVQPEGQKASQEPQTPSANETPFGESIAEIFTNMAYNKPGSFFSRLDEFEVVDATVAVRDQQFGLSWYLTDLDFSLEESLRDVRAAINIELPSGLKKDANFSFDIVYRKKSKDFLTTGKITDLNPYFLSKFLPFPETLAGQDLYFSGDLTGTMDDKMAIKTFDFKGNIPQGSISIPSEFEDPIVLKNIVIKSQFDKSKNTMNLGTISGEISGIAFQGQGVVISQGDVLTAPIKFSAGNLSSEQILSVFPKSEYDGEAYQWLGKKIQGAMYNDVSLDMELVAAKIFNKDLNKLEWDVKTPKLDINFGFENAKITYSDTLMPVESASGTGNLNLATQILSIKGNSAKIGDISGTDVNLEVTHLLTKGAGVVNLKSKLNGPVSTALNFIAAEPINMNKDDIGIDASKVSGNISADLEISMPTLKDVPKEDVKVSINGVLSDMNVPDIVSGLPLSGGPLTLVTEQGGFKIKGVAKLAGRDVTLDWHQYFESQGNPYSMKIDASIGADKELRNHFGVDLDEYISGTMPIDLVYTSKGDGTAMLDVKGDLNPVIIHINPFKFEKPTGVAGSVTLNAFLKDDVLKVLKNINIQTRDFIVPNANISFAPLGAKKAELSKGSLPNITLGKTKMDVTFDLSKDNIMMVNAKGPVFDMGPFLMDDAVPKNDDATYQAKEKRLPMAVALKADKMLLKNGQETKTGKVNLNFDDDGDITQLEFNADVGASPLNISFKPDETGKRAFRLETNDAGSVLNAFGMYENVRGGVLNIYGEPKGDDVRGNIYGTMRMENFRVVKAPALASLLSLMSLTGVGDLLNDEGLVFSKLESGFEWRFRDTGNLLIIKNGQTSGSSIGLTFSGFIDRGQQKTDVAGTIIPMTEVTSIISKIPLVGDILGGSSGLIAATYSMKGPTSKPEVTVNPLSVLAPGIIRRILFEDGFDESKIPKDVATKEKAAPKKSTQPLKSKSNEGVN